MLHGSLVLLAAAVSLCLAASPAAAHPHVWVVMKSELAYAPDGSVTGVRHAWTFDDMFSTFATQGLEQATKGVFTREELAPLAEVNITSLKEFEYFTYAKVDDKKMPLSVSKDFWLEYKDNSLTLHFTLTLPKPAKARSLELEIYDPSYYVDFAFAEKDAVSLAGAPAACKLAVVKPGEITVAQGQKLGEAFFNSLAATSNWGAQFANRVTVTCP